MGAKQLDRIAPRLFSPEATSLPTHRRLVVEGSCLVSGETLEPRRLASDVSPEAKGRGRAGGPHPGICSCLTYCEVAVYSRDPDRFLVSWPWFPPQGHVRSRTGWGGLGSWGPWPLEWPPPSNVCPLRARQPPCEDSWAVLAMGSGGQCGVAATRSPQVSGTPGLSRTQAAGARAEDRAVES